ncbi:hemin uptake protein HemP [Aquabacterium sp.]|uniref:hemin uptake protein HemP n=1 Tax=Aquabacterium sp. TaxID=1872578 RepID=UPI002D0B462D|nr:hemin uptake protein HemP [Aquabacterium sp.]HSW04123.1 hemin uptake protein HemP [Aquabacterium sp.]
MATPPTQALQNDVSVGNAPAPGAAAAPGLQPTVRIRSEQLFSGAQEVHIEHHGLLYRLRQTSLGKLILTK